MMFDFGDFLHMANLEQPQVECAFVNIGSAVQLLERISSSFRGVILDLDFLVRTV